MPFNPYNQLLILPFRERFAAKKRIQRGESIFGGGGLVSSSGTKGGWKEVVKKPPLGALDKALKLLGLKEEGLTKEVIAKAARALSLEHHPDRGGSVDKFHEVMEARDLCLKHVDKAV